jgi:alpha-ribazole phosphatase
LNKNKTLILVRHAPVKKQDGYIPKNNPSAVINLDHIQKLSCYIPKASTCYVSPLKRTIQTAKALSKFVNFEDITETKDLVEQNFGDWAGKRISDVWEELKHNKSQHNFSFICPETCPPNGDSYLDQCKRVANFIDNFNFDNKNSVVLITHAGTIRAILSHILEIEPDKSIGIEISHLSCTLIEVINKNHHSYRGGRYRLLKVNQQII